MSECEWFLFFLVEKYGGIFSLLDESVGGLGGLIGCGKYLGMFSGKGREGSGVAIGLLMVMMM